MGTYTASFDGEVAFVTGSSGGMGRACVLAFAAAGAQVVSCDVNQAGGDETVALAAAAGGTAVVVKADVSDSEQMAAAVQVAVTQFGRLDCAVNRSEEHTSELQSH